MQAGVACSRQCHCDGCENKYGKRPGHSESTDSVQPVAAGQTVLSAEGKPERIACVSTEQRISERHSKINSPMSGKECSKSTSLATGQRQRRARDPPPRVQLTELDALMVPAPTELQLSNPRASLRIIPHKPPLPHQTKTVIARKFVVSTMKPPSIPHTASRLRSSPPSRSHRWEPIRSRPQEIPMPAFRRLPDSELAARRDPNATATRTKGRADQDSSSDEETSDEHFAQLHAPWEAAEKAAYTTIFKVQEGGQTGRRRGLTSRRPGVKHSQPATVTSPQIPQQVRGVDNTLQIHQANTAVATPPATALTAVPATVSATVNPVAGQQASLRRSTRNENSSKGRGSTLIGFPKENGILSAALPGGGTLCTLQRAAVGISRFGAEQSPAMAREVRLLNLGCHHSRFQNLKFSVSRCRGLVSALFSLPVRGFGYCRHTELVPSSYLSL